jgi:lipopolysaccharide/colanic/teichoic acid biosynthesis glycosyltransferase
VLDLLRALDAAGLRVSLALPSLEVTGAGFQFEELDGIPLVGLRPYGLTRTQASLKRASDVAGSAVMIAVLAPVLLGIAVAVKLGTPGPVLFRQQRSGRGGKPFAMLKFRTMVTGADERMEDLAELNQAAPLFKIAADPRVTPVGRFLRRHSLDELPQLFNVLKGDMSLVGPRPFVLVQSGLFEGWQRARYELRPGMTGPWQALGTMRVPFEVMVKLDYVYSATWSLWTDVKIMIRTLRYMIPGDAGRFSARGLDTDEAAGPDAQSLLVRRR